MRRARRILASAVVLLAVLVAAIVGVVRHLPPRAAGVPAHLVPASWTETRASAGHRAHVEKKGIACHECHASFEKEGFHDPGEGPCLRCHKDEAKHTHGGEKVRAGECTSCHTFKPNEERPTCIGCHRETKGHAAAIGVHATTTCTECHTPHGDPATTPRTCTTCHEGVHAERHAEHEDSKGCADCHAPHTPAAQAKGACSTCHKSPSGPRPAGHAACVGCHQPHVFAASAATCVGCHTQKPTLAAAQAPAHAVCTSCHTPHAPANAASSCVRCHADVRVDHDDHAACVTCHAPHPRGAAAMVATTSNGHAPLAKACTTCHQTIARADTKAHAGAIACTSCHTQHDFAPKEKPAICAGCHAREATLVSASSSRGHADCTECHGDDAHRPTAAPACGTCHAKERATAPRGHLDCRNCHDSHGASRAAPKAACSACHVAEASTPHARVEGGCETCHRPHGPDGVASPPACTTCHARPQLPALHAVDAHADCATCHTSHAPPRSERASCTAAGCHVDRRDHQPQAAVCTGCHVFRR